MPKYCEYSKYEQYRIPEYFKSTDSIPEYRTPKCSKYGSVPEYRTPKYLKCKQYPECLTPKYCEY